jgi:hypothetical protein
MLSRTPNKARHVKCKINDWDETLKCSQKGDLDYYLDMDGFKFKYTLCLEHFEMVKKA